MAGLGALLFLAGVIVVVTAGIAFFKPLPKLRMATRKSAVIGLCLGVGSCVTGLAITPTPPTDDKQATEKQAAEKPATKAAAPVEVPDDSGLLEAQTQTLWAQIKSESAPCDQAATGAAEVVQAVGEGRGDMVDAWRAANRAQNLCRESWLALDALDPPKAAKGEARESFKKAIDQCGTAYFRRYSAFEKLTKILNGEGRPSDQAEFQDGAQQAQALTMLCALQVYAAAGKAGVKIPEFEKALKDAESAEKKG